MIETMIHILRSGNQKDLDMLIHQGLLPKHTYLELAMILEDMLEREQTLPEKTELPDDLDKELEETLMAWAFSYRESYIAMHEQVVITQFSQHLMDLFNADKQAYLAAEAAKKRAQEQSRRARHLATIYEGTGKGAESAPEAGPPTDDLRYLSIRPSVPFRGHPETFEEVYPEGVASRESSEVDSRYIGSLYGIAGTERSSLQVPITAPVSDEGEGEDGFKGHFIDQLEEQIKHMLHHYAKGEGAEEEAAEDDEFGRRDVGGYPSYAGTTPHLRARREVRQPGAQQREVRQPGAQQRGVRQPDAQQRGARQRGAQRGARQRGEDEEEERPEEYWGHYSRTNVDLLHYHPGHPSSVHDHTEFTVCCVTVRKYAEWIYAQSLFLEKWNKMYYKCVRVLREFEERKKKMGAITGEKYQFTLFENRMRQMMKIIKQYREYTDGLGEGIFESFKGKKVICCRKCLQENRLPEMDNDPAHRQLNELIVSMKGMRDWEAILETMVDPDDILNDLRNNAPAPKTPAKPSGKGAKGKQPKKKDKKQQKKKLQITTIYEIVEMNTGSDDTLYVDIEEL